VRKPSLNARSGIDRDERARDRRIAAEVAAQAAATPDVAESANAVNAAPEKPSLQAGDFFALVEADGTITPLPLDALKTWLESTYVMTPQP
jgi:hypothetical protein